jgi:hypothetical protein
MLQINQPTNQGLWSHSLLALGPNPICINVCLVPEEVLFVSFNPLCRLSCCHLPPLASFYQSTFLPMWLLQDDPTDAHQQSSMGIEGKKGNKGQPWDVHLSHWANGREQMAWVRQTWHLSKSCGSDWHREVSPGV